MKHYIERYVFIGCALVFIYKGSTSLINAKVEMHKIEGFLCLLIASVLVAGAYIINAIRLLHKETKGRRTMDAHVQNLTEKMYRMEKAS
jgi:amino acid permease